MGEGPNVKVSRGMVEKGGGRVRVVILVVIAVV